LWAALHDRPLAWACDPRHWTTTRLRPARLPSQSTVSRRTRRVAFGLFLNSLSERLRGDGLPGLALTLDGKPLLVGGCSKDPAGGRGYQLVAAQHDKNPGTGHHYQSPFRLRCIELLRGEFGKALFALRPAIERAFGNATAFAGGLAPLPTWVRRQHRVDQWV